jgi:hypothetical protein
MAEMGAYCQAFQIKQLREFEDWHADLSGLRREVEGSDDPDVQRELTEDDVLYLQENFVVTDGIYKDEDVVFSEVTERWKAFCRERLQFEIPLTGGEPASEEAADGATNEQQA